MELKGRNLLIAQQALGYAVMYAKTESETAEFALLKLDIDGALVREEAEKQKKIEHAKTGCPIIVIKSLHVVKNVDMLRIVAFHLTVKL